MKGVANCPCLALDSGKSFQLFGFVRGNAGTSGHEDKDAVRCDKCATVWSSETGFLLRIRGGGHTGFRSENPRVGGSIPPLGTVLELHSSELTREVRVVLLVRLRVRLEVSSINVNCTAFGPGLVSLSSHRAYIDSVDPVCRDTDS